MTSRPGIVAIRRQRDLVMDMATALSLYGLFIVTLLVGKPFEPFLAGEWPILVAGGALALPLTFRRLAPLTVLVAVTAGVIWFQTLQPLNLVVPLAALGLAIYSAGVHGRPVARDVLRVAAALALSGLLLWIMVSADVPAAVWPPRLALTVIVVAAAWVTGEQTRRGRSRERELATRTAELQAERRRSMQQAATEERLRIARELHDVLGHHVSLMGVQASGAQRVLTKDPERARSALEAIEESSRRAVTEVQRVLALLRSDDDARPELARLNDMVADVRHAGVPVTVEVDEPPELPTSVDLAAARVVQEALTNVLRHAGPGSAALVRITSSEDAIHVVVEDDGRGSPPPRAATDSGGRGLIGLRERVELHHGRFKAGVLPGGGYRVTATLPLNPWELNS